MLLDKDSSMPTSRKSWLCSDGNISMDTTGSSNFTEMNRMMYCAWAGLSQAFCALLTSGSILLRSVIFDRQRSLTL